MKLHNLEDSGSLQDIQLDNTQSQIISQTLSQDIKLHESPVQWGYVIDTDSKLDIKLQNYESKPATITVIKIGGIEDLNPLNFTNHMPTTMNPMHHQVVIQDKMLVDQIHQQAAMGVTKMKEKPKKKYTPQTLTSTPAVVCQNCDGSFSTKYQFQRHQCEFNASKVILKSEIPKRQIEKPKTKHECDVCHKSFMTDHNLDRHRLSHGDKKPFTCQNCGKGFVLESRLNTHIETHCKLSTAEPKRFYKTDLSVWQCWNCQLITATEPNHLIHICDLTNPTFISPKVIIPLQQNPTLNDEHNKIVNTNNTFIFTAKQDENGIATTLYENTRMDVYHDNNLTTTSDTTTSMLSTQNNFDENFEKAINDGIAVDTVSTTSSYESTDPQLDSTQESNNITSTTMLLQEKQEQSHTFKIISVEQLFQCEYCNRTYANKDVLKEHQNSHGTDKNYQCMFCDDSFDSYTNALIHWQHKCDEKTNLFCLPKIIICKFCDKGFKSHELLYAHKYKLKHFVPKVFKDDSSMQIESVTLSSQHVDYQQQNGDEFTTLFDNSQHDDCSNSHDDVKPNFNITYTVDNGTHHHHLYTEMHDRNNDLVNFDMNNNVGGYVDTITITEFTKKDSEQHLQLTVDDTNNILQLNDIMMIILIIFMKIYHHYMIIVQMI
ncbi:gastrula zinc finger protein xFG20-1-like [Chrysoperla carnea]|uniref:gastrula zinc finger protein xFG20-1-like n=1 Tax=Chrysoperla carnea TaxID=189513 RepID=UPI001D08B75E|nr:gastrula zinc finger protein xFG20-1-like [Chrysoperla carnea]